MQTGIVGDPLPDDLRVVITRDGAPLPGVTVAWTDRDGSLAPPAAKPTRRGSAATWTLGTTPGTTWRHAAERRRQRTARR